jgi:hypothetical protein
MGRQAADLTGQTFGRLEVVSRVGSYRTAHATWRCRCACGNEITAIAGNLRSGKSRSCGCGVGIANKARKKSLLKREKAAPLARKQQLARGVVRFLTHQGKHQSLQRWADEVGLNYQTIQHRLGSGWSVKRALTTPKRKWTRKAEI